MSQIKYINESSKSFFIHGMSRSGTTLLCSILNAHKSISMGYELYPGMLFNDNKFSDCLDILFYLKNFDINNIFNDLCNNDLIHISRFLACVGHSGISCNDLCDILALCAKEKLRIVDEESVLKLILRISSVKNFREKKKFWGAKASGDINLYKKVFPNSNLFI